MGEIPATSINSKPSGLETTIFDPFLQKDVPAVVTPIGEVYTQGDDTQWWQQTGDQAAAAQQHALQNHVDEVNLFG